MAYRTSAAQRSHRSLRLFDTLVIVLPRDHLLEGYTWGECHVPSPPIPFRLTICEGDSYDGCD